MPTVALKAHYDGERIVLDEPFEIPPRTSLIVTLLSSADDIDSDEVWLRTVLQSQALAFLADPVEDIYTAQDGDPIRDAK